MCTSRRKFVKEIAGVAVAGAPVSAPCVCRAFAVSAQDAAGTGQRKSAVGGGEKLVAPCGLYCGACPMYLATQENSQQRLNAFAQQFSAGKMQLKLEDVLCDGCYWRRPRGLLLPRCASGPALRADVNVTRCSDCSDVPCTKVTNFNNDGMQHHSEVLENLRRVREIGISRWTKYEEDRWHCHQCKGKLVVVRQSLP